VTDTHYRWRDDQHRATHELRAKTALAHDSRRDYHHWFVVHAFNRRQQFDEDQTRETKLYAICTNDGERWKFGHAVNPVTRRSNLQVGSADPLILFAAVPARQSLEKYIHTVLDEHRLTGEWFSGASETLVIAEVLLSIEQLCEDMERADEAVPIFEDTLAWLFSGVEEFLLTLEQNLRDGHLTNVDWHELAGGLHTTRPRDSAA
jgi:hypothetical protein